METMEPHVQLAFAMHAAPGAYAVLLGAGASIASGMPSAWDVQQDLIRRVAAADKAEEIGDPHTWYEERFGRPATYDTLLATLTSTPYERQILLRSYFEPDEQEREEGRKRPTAAHHAIARLAAAGIVRIVLTTNFDRLAETALREAGIEPTVVAHPDDITGLAPLHTIKCLVVHVHGDYLNPTSMLNTPEELEHYDLNVDALLDRVCDEYGLANAGWSATYDPALRNALSRCTTRRFATFWTDPRPLSETAHDLLTRRAATYVTADADTFLAQTADAVAALNDIAREHPVSTAIAVASAKRALAGTRQAISLHDTLGREFTRITNLPLRQGPWNVTDERAEYGHRLDTLSAEIERLLALVATCAYWGSAETDRWWINDIEQLAEPSRDGGLTSLLNLVRAPAAMVTYAAGVAALAAERWRTLARILTEPHTPDSYANGRPAAPVAVLLGPGTVLAQRNASEHLYQQLRPVFTEHLALSPTAYTDAWERFELLRLIAVYSSGKGLDGVPHMRRTGGMDAYRPLAATWLERQLTRSSEGHPLLAEGFCDGDIAKLKDAQERLLEDFNRWATRVAWGAE
ncbi:SIR2 family protein [Streptomyces umbrinus]|uniref:SIR2 family protein n=1 Tax=Streptomyces umbrinus TaxID=67370 RepID=UPI003C2B459B